MAERAATPRARGGRRGRSLRLRGRGQAGEEKLLDMLGLELDRGDLPAQLRSTGKKGCIRRLRQQRAPARKRTRTTRKPRTISRCQGSTAAAARANASPSSAPRPLAASQQQKKRRFTSVP